MAAVKPVRKIRVYLHAFSRPIYEVTRWNVSVWAAFYRRYFTKMENHRRRSHYITYLLPSHAASVNRTESPRNLQISKLLYFVEETSSIQEDISCITQRRNYPAGSQRNDVRVLRRISWNNAARLPSEVEGEEGRPNHKNCIIEYKYVIIITSIIRNRHRGELFYTLLRWPRFAGRSVKLDAQLRQTDRQIVRCGVVPCRADGSYRSTGRAKAAAKNNTDAMAACLQKQ